MFETPEADAAIKKRLVKEGLPVESVSTRYSFPYLAMNIVLLRMAGEPQRRLMTIQFNAEWFRSVQDFGNALAEGAKKHYAEYIKKEV